LLELVTPLPPLEAEPSIYPGSHVRRGPISVFAFPQRQPDGVHSDIVFKGTVADKWWQADSTPSAQYRIQPGFTEEVRLDDNKFGIFGARRANVAGWEHESPVSRVWNCQNPSKVAILASTRPSSGGCRLRQA
jgi:hypothetical protein